MKIVKQTFCGLACALALALGGGVHAGMATFDNPSVVTIDPITNVATYIEGGLRFSGDATSYLPLDTIGSGGSPGLFVFANSPLSLTADGGGLFDLTSVDYGQDPFDPLSGTLLVHGILDGGGFLDETLALGNLSKFPFQGWTSLKEVTFLADANFVLDNVNVPEPASLALVGVALAGLVVTRRRKTRA